MIHIDGSGAIRPEQHITGDRTPSPLTAPIGATLTTMLRLVVKRTTEPCRTAVYRIDGEQIAEHPDSQKHPIHPRYPVKSAILAVLRLQSYYHCIYI